MYTQAVSILLLLGQAVFVAGSENLTIAFTANGTGQPCHAGESPPAGSLSFTTYSAPDAFTCFNFADLFSQSNTSGFMFGNGGADTEPPRNGVNWTIQNQDAYSPGANYSGVWYQQVNVTGDIKQGKVAERRFEVFALRDCRMVMNDDPPSDTPWYQTDCQTATDGECHTVPYSVQSFGISAAYLLQQGDKCQDWVFVGAAARGLGLNVLLAGGSAMAVAWWLMI